MRNKQKVRAKKKEKKERTAEKKNIDACQSIFDSYFNVCFEINQKQNKKTDLILLGPEQGWIKISPQANPARVSLCSACGTVFFNTINLCFIVILSSWFPNDVVLSALKLF